ncbi:CaiB/BaiF CoA-transferase family protein [Amycolatopsis sp. GM8]|uniref:CaiB/BaiF CoA transferase family protein n=1 Tax=Amycolatopsis sp. GM8 TaxID=2896530 RepID=UPI001F366798|nr:CoA transferase [Amycolatopsis sp. GM8]
MDTRGPESARVTQRGGPLAGIVVIDCTSVVMGPYATSLLADLGAEVIKVEPPAGDVGRRIGPKAADGLSALSLRLLRNKTSVVLDLAADDGRRRLTDLVAGADAVVTNILPSARARLGLDYDSLAAVRPDVVLCTGQAYSSHSDRRDVSGYDDTVQALSGMADSYRLRSGEPAYSPSITADKTCGLLMALATVSALYSRLRDGAGQWVDVPMVDNMAAFNLVEHLGGHAFDPPRGDVGWARSLAPGRRPHPASDGWVCVMPYTDGDWRRFVVLAGREDLLDDPRFATVGQRSDRSDEVQAVIAGFVAARTVAEVVSSCQGAKIACAPVRTLDSLVDDDYLRERRTVETLEHPTSGHYRNVRLPLDFSRTPLGDDAPAPPLGGWPQD